MRKHTLTLKGGPGPGLRVPLDVLNDALSTFAEALRRATRFAVEGESTRKGQRPAWLEAACDVRVTGLAEGSALIPVEALTLAEIDRERFGIPLQGGLFGEDKSELSELTVVDVFGRFLVSVVEGPADDVVADRPLLDICANFAKISGGGYSGVELAGIRGRDKPIYVDSGHVPQIERLRDKTPAPQAVRVSGRLDTISESQHEVSLVLKDGTRMSARLEDHDPERLHELFRKQVVISGMAHYRPTGGLRMVVAELLDEAGPGDVLFERAPVARDRKPVAVVAAQDGDSGVSAFFGTWPGEESEEQLLKALRELG